MVWPAFSWLIAASSSSLPAASLDGALIAASALPINPADWAPAENLYGDTIRALEPIGCVFASFTSSDATSAANQKDEGALPRVRTAKNVGRY